MLDIKINHRFFSSKFTMDLRILLRCDGITVISGPSGSGKTTLLRAIAGLLKTDFGQIRFKDEIWQNENLFMPVYQRSVAYVFQEGSLLPHLSGIENIEYALKRSKSNQKSLHIDEVINVLGIGKQLNQLPSQMSGGERQRIAIASAIIRGAKILLMDEPLASLDEQRKEKLILYFNRIKSSFDLPIIYVTHSINEMQSLANEIIFMRDGVVEKQCDNARSMTNSHHFLYLDLCGKDIANNRLCKQNNDKTQMKIRIDQCLLYNELPPSNDNSIIIEVVVDYIDHEKLLLKYNDQTFRISSDLNLTKGQVLWVLCANPQII